MAYKPISEKEKEKQRKYFKEFIKIMEQRFEDGFEKFGNSTVEKPINEIKKEIEEELLDVCVYALLLSYKVKNE